MIRIAGIWDYSWNFPAHEISQWEVLVREFNAERLYMTPITGIVNNVLDEKKSIQDVVNDCKGFTPVFVAENGTNDLVSYEHPENALYIFGRTNYSPFNDMIDQGESIKVITPTNQGLLLSPIIAGIILQDRYNKWLLQ
jgi:hypothetical protein